MKPLFSGRNVVRMGFRPWSGLGLLETFVDGTGKVGVTPKGDERTFDIGEVPSVTASSLLREIPSGGRGGRAGVALGNSDICNGGTVSPPSHDGCCSGFGVVVGEWAALFFPSRRLPSFPLLLPFPCPLPVTLPFLGSGFPSLRGSMPTSSRLLFSVSSRSTRSLHCASNSRRES
jgi:hypothetical protein